MGRSAEAIARRAQKRGRTEEEQLVRDRVDEHKRVKRILDRGREKRRASAAGSIGAESAAASGGTAPNRRDTAALRTESRSEARASAQPRQISAH